MNESEDELTSKKSRLKLRKKCHQASSESEIVGDSPHTIKTVILGI
ncbi:hypothetical protein F383_07153 [Gossypium arboreum]|uniref:Uncharacterized protein n=1 Tax=Gossypium arboreum TaxID=29729 RepID=A0A0B0PPG4_GOSAR|nr:hypothetical protein F383_07153 [Gossypium arboreum]